jgi:hypothetical protein
MHKNDPTELKINIIWRSSLVEILQFRHSLSPAHMSLHEHSNSNAAYKTTFLWMYLRTQELAF